MTIKEYERNGGLTGLGALDVEGHARDVAVKTGLQGNAVLCLLAASVAPGAVTKTAEHTAPELHAALRARFPNLTLQQMGKVLEALENSELVRKWPSPQIESVWGSTMSIWRAEFGPLSRVPILGYQ